MLLHVEPNNGVPIYEQIAAQITFSVASGVTRPGDLVPSVRELAQQLLVNPNTVARAFGELERQGVLVSRRGRGMEVTVGAPQLCRERRQEIIRARIREALREAVSSALADEEIRTLVEEELHRANGEAATVSSQPEESGP